MFEGYFLSDLSLSEIAEETGTSRQAVRDLIGRTKAELLSYEEKIGLMKKRKALSDLCQMLEEAEGGKKTELIGRIREIL